jgi:hypothetical protein
MKANRIVTKMAINEVIAGFLFRDGDIEDVPQILKELYEDYRVEIKKERSEKT